MLTITLIAAITLALAVHLQRALAAAETHHIPGRPEPSRIARISRRVFGPRWRVAACIAHYESTDGAWLVNGPNYGPWQIEVLGRVHAWANPQWLMRDWLYSARVAFRISNGGRDWSPWATHARCGV